MTSTAIGIAGLLFTGSQFPAHHPGIFKFPVISVHFHSFRHVSHVARCAVFLIFRPYPANSCHILLLGRVALKFQYSCHFRSFPIIPPSQSRCALRCVLNFPAISGQFLPHPSSRASCAEILISTVIFRVRCRRLLITESSYECSYNASIIIELIPMDGKRESASNMSLRKRWPWVVWYARRVS